MHEYTNIWLITSQGNENTLPSAVLYSLDAVKSGNADGADRITPVINTALTLTDAYRSDVTSKLRVEKAVNDHLEEQKHGNDPADPDPEPQLCRNSREKLELSEKTSTMVYVLLIAAAAFVGLFAVSVINLSEEVRYVSTLRGIGISKGQLYTLLSLESVLVLVPAMAASIPLSMGMLYAGLDLLNQSRSLSFVLMIPYSRLLILGCLWLLLAMLTRWICAWYSLTFALSGTFYRAGLRLKKRRWIKELLVLCPGCILCLSLFYGITDSRYQRCEENEYRNRPHYRITHENAVKEEEADLEDAVFYRKLLSEEELHTLSAVSGIEKSSAFSWMDVEIRDGTSEYQTLPLLLIDPGQDTRWDQIFHLDQDCEAFAKGDRILLCFPDPSIDPAYYRETAELYRINTDFLNFESFSQDQSSIMLRIFDADHHTVGEIPVDVSARYLSTEVLRQAPEIARYPDCMAVAGSALIRKAADQLPEGTQWFSIYLEKEEYPFVQSLYEKSETTGLDTLLLWGDFWKNTVFTDNEIAAFCKKNALSLVNERQVLMVQVQEQLQKRVLTAVLAICSGLIAFFVLAGIMSVEAQAEQIRFRQLRVLGMSRRQMRNRIFGTVLLRSLSASVCGFGAYLLYRIRLQIFMAAHPLEACYEPEQISSRQALGYALSNFQYYGIGVFDWIRIGLVGVLFTAVIIVASKRKLIWNHKVTGV